MTFSKVMRGYFGSWGRALVAVAVEERFKQESMYGLSAGTKKSGCCREMVVVERWLLVEVHCNNLIKRSYCLKLHCITRPKMYG